VGETSRVLDKPCFVSHVFSGTGHVVVDVSAGQDHSSVDGTARREATKQARFS
jgi:hypothetical protein